MASTINNLPIMLQKKQYFQDSEEEITSILGVKQSVRLAVKSQQMTEVAIMCWMVRTVTPLRSDNSEKNLSQCHLIHCHSYMDCLWIESGLQWWKDDDS
jgi:hypothetical protein